MGGHGLTINALLIERPTRPALSSVFNTASNEVKKRRIFPKSSSRIASHLSVQKNGMIFCICYFLGMKKHNLLIVPQSHSPVSIDKWIGELLIDIYFLFNWGNKSFLHRKCSNRCGSWNCFSKKGINWRSSVRFNPFDLSRTAHIQTLKMWKMKRFPLINVIILIL